MVTPSGSFPAGSQAAAALGASANGPYVDYAPNRSGLWGQESLKYSSGRATGRMLPFSCGARPECCGTNRG